MEAEPDEPRRRTRAQRRRNTTPAWLAHLSRGQQREKGWVGATIHAARRLDQRYDLRLSAEGWATVIDQAREGAYPELEHDPLTSRRRTGDAPVYEVAIKDAETGVVSYVPMVIQPGKGLVVTVLTAQEVLGLRPHEGPA